MGPIIFDAGANEREMTLIPDGAMQNTEGAEYRVGQQGIYVARGRKLYGTAVSGTTSQGLYELGFDSGEYLLTHIDSNYQTSVVAATLGFTTSVTFPSGSLPVVGSHYADRHYLANGVSNLRAELATGVTYYPIGLTRSTFAIGVSITQGAGAMSAATGIVYWATEYDSTRGIESMTGASVSTGAFSGKASVIPFVTGLSANRTCDKIRWYRSVDGGGFPDGGLIATTAIGTTFTTDTLADVADLTVPQYGLISIGGLDTERDEPPDPMAIIFGPFQDSLLGVAVADKRVLRFTPAGYPDSWPSAYGVPIQTPRQDQIVTGVVLPGRIGVFCNDSVQVVMSLPRDSNSVFAAGDAQDTVTDARGAVSRRGACMFTPIGDQPLAAFVSRDGIWGTELIPATSPTPLTDQVNWESRVDVSNLSSCRLVDDPINRRLVFIYRRKTDTTHNTGLWYLDYQRFADRGIRITFADHGPIADAVTIAATDGSRRLASLDSRSANGQVYLESTQDPDDSHLLDSSGSVRFRMVTKAFLPAGASKTVDLGQATWMHDAGTPLISHSFHWNRLGDNPETKPLPDSNIRAGSRIQLSRNVTAFWLELLSVGTTSYGVHWLDVDVSDPADLGGRAGA